LAAQSRDPADLERILQRLDVLEQQNRELMSEIRALREQIASATAAPTAASPPAAPPVAERIDVAEQRIQDLAQTRIESEHHSAIQLTGMVLFNSYMNAANTAAARRTPPLLTPRPPRVPTAPRYAKPLSG